jgi:hypothetical protein
MPVDTGAVSVGDATIPVDHGTVPVGKESMPVDSAAFADSTEPPLVIPRSFTSKYSSEPHLRSYVQLVADAAGDCGRAIIESAGFGSRPASSSRS